MSERAFISGQLTENQSGDLSYERLLFKHQKWSVLVITWGCFGVFLVWCGILFYQGQDFVSASITILLGLIALRHFLLEIGHSCEFYETVVKDHRWYGNKIIKYHDVDSISYIDGESRKAREFGLNIWLWRGTFKFKYSAFVRHKNEVRKLREVRDRITRIVAEKLYEKCVAGQFVEWGKNARVFINELHIKRRFFFLVVGKSIVPYSRVF